MRSLPNRSLDTADILGSGGQHACMEVGAQSHGLVAVKKYERFPRTQLRNTNHTADIVGASAANPVKNRVTCSLRCTNPLTASKNAEYPYLGALPAPSTKSRPQSARSPGTQAASEPSTATSRARPRSAVAGSRGDSRTFSVC
eukprot:TRINITY_DN7440_c0_g1_i3.p4 TRINITY_DN7440_c0_g1~~TRINITY_DN7440_c0_g1_i3.p4  ORF type:complete len:143 (+),score=22.64 TRINITY_DN7440_c0_g1_i3:848-1276(+)